MGFKSALKKIGKVALKAAPFALDFVPGGQIAHLAMAAGLGAATAKKHNLKGMLTGAAMGAGAEYGGHLLKGGSFNPLSSAQRGASASKLLGESSSGFSGGIDGYSDVIPKMGASATDSSVLAGSAIGDVAKPSVLSKAGSYLSKNPTLTLAALSMLGGGGEGSPATPHKQYEGPLVNPTDQLYHSLSEHYRVGQGLLEAPPVTLRSVTPPKAAPVTVAGVQIGGGLATPPGDITVDPYAGIRNYDPFQSIAPGQFDAAKKQAK